MRGGLQSDMGMDGTMKEDARPAVKHEFEHDAPTVIHDPEQDMTILARWLHRGMKQGPRFWFLLVGVVMVAIVVTMIASGLTRGRTTIGQAWTDLAFAQTPGQKVEMAEAFANSEAARAAKLQAGSDYFQMATRDLPNNRESALPQLKKALDLFQQVARDAPKESPEAVAAAFATARTFEARNELTEAVQQYKAVASGWPGTFEAKQSETLAAQLQDPEVIAFYKELYTYKPPAVPSPLGGSFPGLGGGGLPAGHPALDGPTIAAPPVSGIPALPAGMELLRPSKTTTIPSPAPIPGNAVPTDIAPPPATVPEPKSAAKSELPADPFSAPGAKPDAPKP